MILSNTQNKPKRHIKGGWVNPSSLPKNKDGMTQCRWCSGSVYYHVELSALMNVYINID